MKRLFNVQNIKRTPWDTLFKEERLRLLQYACYRTGDIEDARDAVQEAMAKILEHGGRVDNPKGYLYRSVSNACMDIVRMKGRMMTVELDMVAQLVQDEPEDFSQEYQRINLLLNLIPEEQSEVIRLRYYADKSFAEIAGILELPLPTVKSRFLYGLEKMRKAMKQS